MVTKQIMLTDCAERGLRKTRRLRSDRFPDLDVNKPRGSWPLCCFFVLFVLQTRAFFRGQSGFCFPRVVLVSPVQGKVGASERHWARGGTVCALAQ